MIDDYTLNPGDVVVRKPGKPWAGIEGLRVTVHRIDMKHSFYCFDDKGNMWHMFNADVEFCTDP